MTYELFALPCPRESDETKAYATYRQPLGPNGHRSQILYGADTGLRNWSLPYDPINGGTASITVDGVAMSRATYIRDLFDRTQVSGQPFRIQGENGQYYLAEFAESSQTLTKKLTKSYATTIDLVQVRVDDVSVFDVLQCEGVLTWLDASQLTGYTDGQHVGTWTDQSNNGNDFSTAGSTTFYTESIQNDLPVIRLNGSDSNYIFDSGAATFSEVFMVLKMRETTFSNHAGLLTAASTLALIVGENATTTFFDFSATYDALTYKKNGVLYAQDDQQAPMDQFSLINVRSTEPISWGSMQIGSDRNFVGRFADADIGEVVIFETLQPESVSLELSEHLQTKWDLPSV